MSSTERRRRAIEKCWFAPRWRPVIAVVMSCVYATNLAAPLSRMMSGRRGTSLWWGCCCWNTLVLHCCIRCRRQRTREVGGAYIRLNTDVMLFRRIVSSPANDGILNIQPHCPFYAVNADLDSDFVTCTWMVFSVYRRHLYGDLLYPQSRGSNLQVLTIQQIAGIGKDLEWSWMLFTCATVDKNSTVFERRAVPLR